MADSSVKLSLVSPDELTHALQSKKLEAEVLAPMARWTTAYQTVQVSAAVANTTNWKHLKWCSQALVRGHVGMEFAYLDASVVALFMLWDVVWQRAHGVFTGEDEAVGTGAFGGGLPAAYCHSAGTCD